MKIFIHKPPTFSWAIKRVNDALVKYAPPGIEFTDRMHDADCVVINVVGRHDRMEITTSQLKRYAMIQYAFRATRNPDAWEWLPMWDKACLVWSYYDLYAEVKAEMGIDADFNFYHSPLGAEQDIFHTNGSSLERKYLVLSTGLSYMSESVREILAAAEMCGEQAAHLGMHVNKPDVDCYQDISDNALRLLYNVCRYVSGLRRGEGFELPAVEGLLCGARPIVYDKPHYRNWYGDLAEYIPETTRDQIVVDLFNLFLKDYRPVSREEIEAAKERFNWQTIISGFWERIND